MKIHMLRHTAPFLMLAAMAASSAIAGSATPRCLPAEGCGCRILVAGKTCPAGGVHFFHELADGAPLHFDLGTGPAQAPSTRAWSDAFTAAPGDTWSETYRHDGGSIVIRFSPGADTCPKSAYGEACEYWDVNAHIRLLGPRGAVHYRGVGTCGC